MPGFYPQYGLGQPLRDTGRGLASDELGRATSSCDPPQRVHCSFGTVQADDPAQVVRQHMQTHLRLHPWSGFREEVCGAHPELQRPEHMLNRTAPLNSHDCRGLPRQVRWNDWLGRMTDTLVCDFLKQFLELPVLTSKAYCAAGEWCVAEAFLVHKLERAPYHIEDLAYVGPVNGGGTDIQPQGTSLTSGDVNHLLVMFVCLKAQLFRSSKSRRSNGFKV